MRSISAPVGILASTGKGCNIELNKGYRNKSQEKILIKNSSSPYPARNNIPPGPFDEISAFLFKYTLYLIIFV